MTGPIRVLIVDDDPSLADLMATQLGSLQEEFSIRVETDATEALEAAEDGEIDCVVSDYHMPDMDGLELLRYVREMDPDIPFILFTARGSEEIASDAVSEDVTDYFRKRRGSEQWQVLANRIENASARYRAEQSVQRREAALRQLARTVIDSVSTPIEDLLTLGRETLDVEYAAFRQGETADTGGEVLVESIAESRHVATAQGIPLAEELEDVTVNQSGLVTATAEAPDDTENGSFRAYIAGPVYVGDTHYGTLCFCDRDGNIEFSAWERAFVELLADWLGHELTSEWARTQHDAVQTAQTHLEQAREALNEDDIPTATEKLAAIEDLLETDPPSTVPVSIELS